MVDVDYIKSTQGLLMILEIVQYFYAMRYRSSARQCNSYTTTEMREVASKNMN